MFYDHMRRPSIDPRTGEVVEPARTDLPAYRLWLQNQGITWRRFYPIFEFTDGLWMYTDAGRRWPSRTPCLGYQIDDNELDVEWECDIDFETDQQPFRVRWSITLAPYKNVFGGRISRRYRNIDIAQVVPEVRAHVLADIIRRRLEGQPIPETFDPDAFMA